MAIEFIAIFLGLVFLAWFAFGAALLAAYIIENTYNVDPMALSIAKLIAATILTIGIGSMLGAITTIGKLLEVFASFVAAFLILLYKLVSELISRLSSNVTTPGRMIARLADLARRRIPA